MTFVELSEEACRKEGSLVCCVYLSTIRGISSRNRIRTYKGCEARQILVKKYLCSTPSERRYYSYQGKLASMGWLVSSYAFEVSHLCTAWFRTLNTLLQRHTTYALGFTTRGRMFRVMCFARDWWGS